MRPEPRASTFLRRQNLLSLVESYIRARSCRKVSPHRLSEPVTFQSSCPANRQNPNTEVFRPRDRPERRLVFRWLAESKENLPLHSQEHEHTRNRTQPARPSALHIRYSCGQWTGTRRGSRSDAPQVSLKY